MSANEEKNKIRFDSNKYCPLPSDYYKARLSGIHESVGCAGQAVYSVLFEIAEGQFEFSKIRGIINQRSNGIGQMLWRFVYALLGVPPMASKGYDWKELIGRECYINVELIEKGGKKHNAIREYCPIKDFADIEGCRISPKL